MTPINRISETIGAKLSYRKVSRYMATIFYIFWITVTLYTIYECLCHMTNQSVAPVKLPIYIAMVLGFILGLIACWKKELTYEIKLLVINTFLSVGAIIVLFILPYSREVSWFVPRLTIWVGLVLWLVCRYLYMCRTRYDYIAEYNVLRKIEEVE